MLDELGNKQNSQVLNKIQTKNYLTVYTYIETLKANIPKVDIFSRISS